MSVKHKYAARWFDQEDFTSEHDEIMLWLLDHWREILPGEAPKNFPRIDGEIRAEPSLDGYPPIFPDAIASGFYRSEASHNETPLKLDLKHQPRNHLHLVCGVQGCDEIQLVALEKAAEAAGVSISNSFKWNRWPDEWPGDVVAKLRRWAETRRFESHRVCDAETGRNFRVVFEIKPKIDSLGSVLRQLSLYRERARTPDVVLVTRDHRFDRQFEDQGYRVVDPGLVPPAPSIRESALDVVNKYCDSEEAS